MRKMIPIVLMLFTMNSFGAQLNVNVDYLYPKSDCKSIILKLGEEFENYKSLNPLDSAIDFQGGIYPEGGDGYGSFERTVCTARFIFDDASGNSAILHQGKIRTKRENKEFLNLCLSDLNEFKQMGLFPLVIKTKRSFFNKSYTCNAVAVEFKH